MVFGFGSGGFSLAIWAQRGFVWSFARLERRFLVSSSVVDTGRLVASVCVIDAIFNDF